MESAPESHPKPMRGKAAAIAERQPVLTSISVACHPFAGHVSEATHPAGWAIITISVAANRSKSFYQSASIKLAGNAYWTKGY
ncbi:MAG: hypothetical protein GY880_15150 [Planctomycetaceae bacterium]|nr:hypothetical protein [Planctomycetaceae bacterium]MCP4775569.1 hypothetical protein [Planctomycetaceae bacterium]